LGLRLLSPEASFLILDILKDTPRPEAWVSLKNRVAWKTGTSSGYRDAWTVGSVGPYVLAVWVGNFNNQGAPALVGKKIAAPLFFELIDAIAQELGHLPAFKKYPENLQLEKIAVCKASGMLPTRYCTDTEMTWFIPGKSPITSDSIYREVAIDKITGLRSCHSDKNTRFEIVEFWPTDLLKIFNQAGIKRKLPPPYAPGCVLTGVTGTSPHITSPQTGLRYIIRADAREKTRVPMTAVVDGDVAVLYWFVNETYLGKTRPDEPFLWDAKAGKQVVRVVDDHGLSDACDIMVRVES
jgi:penicillin-binding protein 1C